MISPAEFVAVVKTKAAEKNLQLVSNRWNVEFANGEFRLKDPELRACCAMSAVVLFEKLPVSCLDDICNAYNDGCISEAVYVAVRELVGLKRRRFFDEFVSGFDRYPSPPSLIMDVDTIEEQRTWYYAGRDINPTISKV